MKSGKITENIRMRSVVRPLTDVCQKFSVGPREDLAVFSCDGGTVAVSATQSGICLTPEFASFAFYRAIDELRFRGGVATGIVVSVLLKEEAEEQELREISKTLKEKCKEEGITVLSVHAETPLLQKYTMVFVTAIGTATAGMTASMSKKQMTGLQLIIAGPVGTEGTVLLAHNRRQELLKRYPSRMIDEVFLWQQTRAILPEAAVAAKSGICKRLPVTEGGVFGALWELAKEAEVGLKVDLRKIPIRQETIEICNHLDLNPYELLSNGCLLVACEQGDELVTELCNMGIPAAVIGETTGDHDKLICNLEEERYLEPRKPDQLYRGLIFS